MSEAHPTALAHQFDDLEQQRETATLGMWAFLCTEVMMFGGLFTAYGWYHTRFPEGFAQGSNELNYLIGAVNTAVLISSSLTMALAVHASQIGKRKALILFLLLTMLLGGIFLGIKAYEYSVKFEHHLVPGYNFHVDYAHADEMQLFMCFYFAMTGLHAAHMIVGLVILSTLVAMAYRNRFSPSYFSPVENAGLYWHFVDIVWIFLFPLLYLIGRSL